ncbi:hypothetical protein B0H16DRAFT_1593559 [Mycena metata]|uniref:F-box domain-containing protein n=1 Tax=Mycena metata TaxID=1033252 RepID=A0AAD7HQG4_9AGAR|nr:hypothetical protein B0H16DRAFT_1593559 [Mycena metata]
MSPHTARLRARLAEIDEQFILLQKERTTIQNALAALTYPVLTLPAEITSEIFAQCIVREGGPRHPSPAEAPLLFTHVCRTWRDIAVHDSKLWTDFRIRFCPGQCRGHPYVQTYLERAGTRPLVMDIAYEESETTTESLPLPILLQDIIRRSSQWREVTLRLHPSTLEENFQSEMDFSALETLTILTGDKDRRLSSPVGAFAAALKLRVVKLQIRYMSPHMFTLPWSQLTQLHVKNSVLKEAFEILRLAPALVRCIFMSILTNIHGSPGLFSLPPHLQLKSLTVGDPGGCPLLDFLTLPNLEKLQVSPIHVNSQLSSLLSFLTRSPEVSQFVQSPGYCALEPDDMVALFMAMPKLAELRFRVQSPTHVDTILRNLRDSPSFLPCIQTITLQIPYDRDDGYNLEAIQANVLSQALSARWSSASDTATLWDFSLVWVEEDISLLSVEEEYGDILEDELEVALEELQIGIEKLLLDEQLLKLKSEGMVIHIGTQKEEYEDDEEY